MVFAYVEAILEIDKIQESNLDDRKKTRQNNKLADRIRKIASEIECKYPEMKAAFYQLLFHENASVRIWAAHHIVEVMRYDNKCRKNALQEILYIAENDSSVDGLGNRMWLKSWLAEHLADKELL